MKFLNKKETLIQNICFMAFFVAFNVIASLLTVYLPLASVILIIVLPLSSSIVETTCKDRYYPIYALATIGLSLVASLQSIDFTLFYVVPSLFTGFIFGYMSKKNLPDMFAIFFATIIQTGFSYAFVPILKAITGTDIIDIFCKILHISNTFLIDTAIILIFFVVSLVQIILSFIVVDNELKRLGIKEPKQMNIRLIAEASTLLSVLFVVFFMFVYLPIAYLFVGLSWYFVAFIFVEQYKSHNRLFIFVDFAFLLIGIISYAAFNKYVRLGFDFAFFASVPLLVSGFSICYYFLKKPKQ